MIIIDFRFSQEQSESRIHFLNTSSVLQLLKHSKMPLLLPEVGHWVLHCIVQCRELRLYPEELDNNWFYPASAPALLFYQVCTCFCLISCEPIVAATVLSTLAHAPESSPDWSWEHYCQEEEVGNRYWCWTIKGGKCYCQGISHWQMTAFLAIASEPFVVVSESITSNVGITIFWHSQPHTSNYLITFGYQGMNASSGQCKHSSLGHE